MSATNMLETALLDLIFNKTLDAIFGTLSGTGDANFYLALFTADPTETCSLVAEADYGSYARIAVVRTSGGWTVSGNQASNTALVQFIKSTSTGSDVTHVGVCSGATKGAGTCLISLHLTTDTPTTTGIQPQFDAGTLVFTVD
jgi:hypothetical protein